MKSPITILAAASVLMAMSGVKINGQTSKESGEENYTLKITELDIERHTQLLRYNQPDSKVAKELETIVKPDKNHVFIVLNLRLSVPEIKDTPVKLSVIGKDGVELRLPDRTKLRPMGSSLHRKHGQLKRHIDNTYHSGNLKPDFVSWVFEIPDHLEHSELTISGTIVDKEIVGQTSVTQAIDIPNQPAVAEPPHCEIKAVRVHDQPYRYPLAPNGKIVLEVPEKMVFWEIVVTWSLRKDADPLLMSTPHITLSGSDGEVFHPAGELHGLTLPHFTTFVQSCLPSDRDFEKTVIFALPPEVNRASLRYATNEVAKINLERVREPTEQPVDGVITGHYHWVNSIAWTPDSKTLVTGSRDTACRLWNAAEETLLFMIPGLGSHYRVALSHDGSTLAASMKKQIEILDFTTREVIQTIPFKDAYALELSADGSLVAAAKYSDKNMLRLWNTKTGEMVGAFEGHESVITDIAFSPNGTLIAASDFDGITIIRSLPDGEILYSLDDSRHATHSIAFTPDGKYFATAGSGSQPKLWDVNNGQLVREFKSVGHDSCLAISPDGTHIAITGSRKNVRHVRLFELSTGKALGEFPINQESIKCMDFSPDGKTIAVGSYDNNAYLIKVDELM